MGSEAFAVPGSRYDQKTAPPKPGYAQPCPLALLTPGGRQGASHGASGTPDDLPEYLALTLQAGLCRVGPNLSLASPGTKMNSILNKKLNSAVGEAGAEVDAELGLKRSSTNPPLQTAPTESQMLTVAAGPGSSGSGTNVVPWQVVTEKDANQQATAGAFSDRKRLTGSQKRKQRQRALRVNEVASAAAAAQSSEAGSGAGTIMYHLFCLSIFYISDRFWHFIYANIYLLDS